MQTTAQVDALAIAERSIYANLKMRIYIAGIRQNQLAKLVGIDEGYLSRIVNGVRVPKQQLRQEIAQVLGCDPDWLFERTRVHGFQKFSSEASS